jgi:endonuclease YncB( thermonuclease family)
MSERKNKRFLRFAQVSLLGLAAAGYWYYENVYQPQIDQKSTTASTEPPADAGPLTFDPSAKSTPSSAEANTPTKANTTPKQAPKATVVREVKPSPSPAPKASIEKMNGYDRLNGTVMVEHRNNDGDSFFVRHGTREFELRVYYADTPEKYLSDRYADQRKRVAEQAREMGKGLSIDETVALGQQAKAHVAKILKGQSFTVFTKWERVFDGERYYCFVLLPDETEWLSEELLENGIARIHTKGESTPDGKSYRDYKKHLETLEAQARSAKLGAWK